MQQGKHPFFSVALLIFVGILATIGIVLWLVRPVLVPLLIAGSICVIVSPLMDSLSRKGVSRSTASLLMLLLLTIVSSAILVLILPPFMDIISRAPLVLENIGKILASIFIYISGMIESYGLPANIMDMNAAKERMSDVDLELISTTSSSIASIMFTIVLVPVLCFFMLRDYENFRNKCLRWLPNRYFELGCRLYFRITEQLESYVRHVILQQCILGVNAAIGFFAIGLPHPILLGILTAFCGLIPYIGPLLALLAPTLMIMTMPDAELLTLSSAVLVIAVVFLIDNVIVIPTLVAGAVNLHPLLVVVAVIIGGTVAGPIGMVLSIPAVASLRLLVVELIIGLRPLARREARGV